MLYMNQKNAKVVPRNLKLLSKSAKLLRNLHDSFLHLVSKVPSEKPPPQGTNVFQQLDPPGIYFGANVLKIHRNVNWLLECLSLKILNRRAKTLFEIKKWGGGQCVISCKIYKPRKILRWRGEMESYYDS